MSSAKDEAVATLLSEATDNSDRFIAGAPNGQHCLSWWNYLRCLHPWEMAVMSQGDQI